MWGRHPYRLAALVAGGVLVVSALAAGGLYLWLRTYAPLSASGVQSRGAYTAFTLHNTGRFAVTVTGLARPARRVELLATDSPTSSTFPGHLYPFVPLRLDPGDEAILVLHGARECGRAVRLRYDYLSIFSRSSSVPLPAAAPGC